MLATLLDRLGITDWNLELNSVGTPADRAAFNEALRKALDPVKDKMCGDCQRRVWVAIRPRGALSRRRR